MMKNKQILLLKGVLLWGVFTFLFSCTTEQYSHQQDQSKGEPFNPNLPVEISGFVPDAGKVREKVVITGYNFGNDRTKIKVYFNDGISDKEANVISVDGTSIYCLAPRQATGNSQIKVSVSDSQPVTAATTFNYTAAITVSWIAGAGLRDGTGGKHVDGTLSESFFWRPHGIVSLGDNQLMTFGFWESPGNNVRLISIDDDRVITLQNGVYLGKGTTNQAKTRVYATTMNPPHTVYEYRKESGWTPYNIGVIKDYGSGNDRIRSLVMLDETRDPNQEWVYFIHKNSAFGRFNINTEQTEIISEGLNIPARSWGGYMAYDTTKDCFYVSIYESYSIYKISKTGSDWGDGVEAELFAGSPSSSAVVDGELQDARFRTPMGLCVDEEGNIFVADAGNANVIRKISGFDGYVSTVAGTVGVEKPQVSGDPAESIFLVPYDVTYDGEGGYYIVEHWEATIRKYSVE